MRRVLLFLALAGGGLAALATLGGGFRGSATQDPPPVVSEVPHPARTAGDFEPVRANELAGGRAGAVGDAPIELGPADRADQTIDEATTWTDPATGESIAIRNAPKAAVTAYRIAPMRDTAGSPGMRWKRIHIVLFRDKKRWTRADAEALAANPKTGRKGLEQYDITADEGYETTTVLPGGSAARGTTGRTVIHVTQNVVIHDYLRKLDVRTSDAVIDYDAQSAEGAERVEVESAAYLVHGRGFRLNCRVERLEILENTEFESLDGARTGAGSTHEATALRPRRVRAKGSTLITRHADKDAPFTDVWMEGGVHVEMDGGQHLDAETVALRIGRRGRSTGGAGGANVAPAAPSDADAGVNDVELDRMAAAGDVRYEGRDRVGAPMTAAGPKLDVDFHGKAVSALRLSGKSLVTWRGELKLPGERPADRIVRASASESILFGPDPESPGEDAALLDLVGTARVECGHAPSDGAPQRIAADRVSMHLRRRRPAGEGSGAPSSEWIATSFAATGGVTLDGPRIRGASREMKGFDLDRPTYHLSATGPDAHLEIADESEPAGRDGVPSRSTDAAISPASSKRRTWVLDRLLAREQAMGALRARVGEGAASFAGDTFTYRRETGAEIRAKTGEDAHLTLEGRVGRDRTIDAPAIFLRSGATERTLETVGRTRAVFWVGDEDGGATPAPDSGHRVVELRSGSRIDITGTNGGKEVDASVAVTLADGGAISARTDGVVTDRLTATSIELALLETVPLPGESGFALAGRHEGGSGRAAAPRAGGARGAATTPGRFVLQSDALTLSVAAEGKAGTAGALERLDANGRVTIEGDDAKEGTRRFEGTRFTFDARTGAGVLLGTQARSASITLGAEPAVDRILSPRVDVSFVDGRVTRAVFAPPVRGAFHARPAAGSATREFERYVLESEGGALVAQGATASIEGSAARPVYVQRTLHDGAGRMTGDALTITTPRLVLTMSAPFGTPGSTLSALDAVGAGSRIDAGLDATKRQTATGDAIRFERPAGAERGASGRSGVLHITSSRGAVVVTASGRSIEGTDVTYDFADGKIHATFRKVVLDPK